MEIIRAQTDIAQLGLDLGGVMAFVTERVQQLTDAGGAIVELAEGDEMVYRAASGMAKNQLGLRLRRIGSLSGLCVQQRTVLRCDDSENDVRVDKEACRKVGLRSMVVAPLNHGETTVGVLKIAAAEPNVFSDEHVNILQLMCGLIASPNRVETVCRPIHVIGTVRPSVTTTRSPRRNVSTATSPDGVRIRVPGAKHRRTKFEGLE